MEEDHGVFRRMSSAAIKQGSNATYVVSKSAHGTAHAVTKYLAGNVTRTADETGITEGMQSFGSVVNNAFDTVGDFVDNAFGDDEVEIDEDVGNSEYDLLLGAPGVVDKAVGARSIFSQVYLVPAGSVMVWKARVQRGEIDFAIREIREVQTLMTEVDVESKVRYHSYDYICGQIKAANHPRKLNMIFDNSISMSNSKNIAFWVSIGTNVSLADEKMGAARTMEVRAADEGPLE